MARFMNENIARDKRARGVIAEMERAGTKEVSAKICARIIR